MSNTPEDRLHRSSLVDTYLTMPVSEWPPAIFSIMVDHLNDALGVESKVPLTQVSEQLSDLMNVTLKAMPEDARRQVLDDKGGPFHLAFLLGQLSFAHQFASTTASQRPDDAFYKVFRDEPVARYCVVLSAGPASLEEVAAHCATSVASLRATFRQWMELGIVDYRSRFGSPDAVEYFLTPAARQMLKLPGS